MEKHQGIRVLDRAFDILEALAAEAELTLGEISVRTGLALATAYRSVQTMVSRGYIDQDARTGKYRLGMQIVRLSGQAVSRIDVIRVATPHLQDLSKRTGLNVNLSIFDNGKALCLVNIETMQDFMMGIKVGQRLPIHAGALSKVILANLPPEQIPALLGNLEPFTPHTIANKDTLQQELDTIRSRGYAVSNGELAVGVSALAAPLFDHGNRAVAGISLSGPKSDFSEENTGRFIEELLAAASQISRELGYRSL
ncbi:IclR family transcriptional regulator [Brevibacillus sp. H7]|uniref:IclR family transcriptional regulator n=1 Tax=Brevibacillus sp. H7 TaxID=3349138 RepID=UPI0038083E14